MFFGISLLYIIGLGHDITPQTRKVQLAYYNSFYQNVFKDSFIYLASEDDIGKMVEVTFHEHRKFWGGGIHLVTIHLCL